MPAQSNETYNATLVGAASTLVKTGFGVIGGVFVSTSTTGTITVYDGTSAAGTKIIDTFTVVAPAKFEFRAACANGIFVVTGGTISATILWT